MTFVESPVAVDPFCLCSCAIHPDQRHPTQCQRTSGFYEPGGLDADKRPCYSLNLLLGSFAVDLMCTTQLIIMENSTAVRSEPNPSTIGFNPLFAACPRYSSVRATMTPSQSKRETTTTLSPSCSSHQVSVFCVRAKYWDRRGESES